MDYERTVLKKRSRWGLYVVVEQRGTSMTKLMVRSECMLRMVRWRPLRVQFCARWFSTKKNTAEAPRINPVGIQYLGESLQRQVFGSCGGKDEVEQSDKLMELSKKSLKDHGLWGKKTLITDPISFPLPPLQGRSLDEHFQKIGRFNSEPYKSFCEDKFTEMVARPAEWLRKPGWVKYVPGMAPVEVAYPDEELVVFDVETLYNVSDYPTLATALSSTAWYLWCSPFICGGDDPAALIPLNTLNKEQVVIGHNVAYDRARVLEEYNFRDSKAFFLDTQSLHIASFGLCSRQRPMFMKNNKKKEAEVESEVHPEISIEDYDDPWLNVSALNSLKDVAKFHCKIDLDKTDRDFFASTDKSTIIENFQKLVNYCATDVTATSQVFDKIFPVFLKKCPHPVSFAGLKSLSKCILPTKLNDWNDYLNSSESLYQQSKVQIESKIVQIIKDIVLLKDKPDFYLKDPWLSQLDWTTKPLRLTKKGVPAKCQKLPGFPEWYRQLFPSKDTVEPKITIKSRIIPILFKLSWENSPVIWSKESGWCFNVPHEQVETYKAKNYVLADSVSQEEEEIRTHNLGLQCTGVLFKVPHPNGPTFNCTNLLTKSYNHFFEKGVLKSESELAHQALQINSSGSYWMSARERIQSQFVVPSCKFPNEFQSLSAKSSLNNEKTNDLAIIIPKIVPMGTITRRAVENTWLTASNAKANRIGSELKTQVKAPPGYCFVGADVDSEELWIASLVGDSIFNVHGGTAIGWMCLEGTKNEGTDLHTKTAQILGCSRNEAKIFNYGRIYGAGAKFASQLLKRFNPSLTDEETKKIANKLYENTKGKTKRSKLFKKFWYGGSESILFNKLESIAEQETPKTLVLGCGITYSLMKKNLRANSFLPSRINWAIQSSGVDYLHLLCCSMEYIIKKYNLEARLCISIHDEIRFLVSEKDKYRAAMALQISNIWTRAMFCQQMGINELPQNCAFFSQVDIDSVIRKEVNMDCITPSNKTAIPHGEALDINQLLDKPNSKLGKPNLDIDSKVSQYAYNYREPVFEEYNKSYTPEFLKYFLAMQVQSDKRDVNRLEDEYLRECTSKEYARDGNTAEYSLLDYIKDVEKGKRTKVRIMGSNFLDGTKNAKADQRIRLPVNMPDYPTLHKIANDSAIPEKQLLENRRKKENRIDDENKKKLTRKKNTTPMERKYKRVYGGRKAFEAFYECANKPLDYTLETEKQFFNIPIDGVIDDVLNDKSNYKKKPSQARTASSSPIRKTAKAVHSKKLPARKSSTTNRNLVELERDITISREY
ncbi:CFC_collapsed_G0052290.mRNA.1.CDS.1 [Saccharomyces cerevisiae]|nr:CFC_collapsed_G0052290.mRNA.1.CDS.1 [Saccharomyces cerevisiae]